MNKTVTVGISDLNIVTAPDMLVTYALGSCVGICIYDPVLKIAGLAHIMLPDSLKSREGTLPAQQYRYADTAIAVLVKKMEAMGSLRIRMKSKIAGGAQMFPAMGDSDISNIGRRNVEAVRTALAKHSIGILADHTGENYGRTVYFSAADGSMRVKSAVKGEWVL